MTAFLFARELIFDVNSGGAGFDHRFDQFENVECSAETGFRIARIRYYTPIVGGFVENILVRMAERQMARRAARRLASKMDAASADRQAIKEARSEAKARIAASATTRAGFRALTAAMKLDLLLFGSIESGPFFALLERLEPRTSGREKS